MRKYSERCGNNRKNFRIFTEKKMLYRETSARNAIKLRLSIISILLFSKNILQGASITLTSQMPWLRFVNAMFTLRKCRVYAS